jgi:hypothetical protein
MNATRHYLALTPGNPMNPVTLILLAFFGIALIVFPAIMLRAGLGAGSAVLIDVIILLTAALCLGFTLYLARRYDADRRRLLSGEHWAHWQLPTAEREQFVTGERERSHREASRCLLYTLVAALFGALVGWLQVETATGALLGFMALGAAGLIVVATTYPWGGARPREEAANLGDIYLGELGIYHLGRYTPVRGVNLFLTGVELQPGDPTVLQFAVSSRGRYGLRTNEVRVAVPAGREAEAAALAERFQSLVVRV